MALSALAYLPGLSGPFVFDDPQNILLPMQAWLSGHTGWMDIVLGNDSGLLHRPLSMLTFLANAATTGLAVLPFKVTNLAIHLACGVLIFLLLAKLLRRDRQLARHASLAAFAVTALWLLHPMQVSTVLYVVQRMAQLSALFMLLGLLAYVHSRFALVEGRIRKGMLLLWLAVPAATLAAMFSKENGALVPLLCAVIELGYFRSTAAERRPATVKLWFLGALIAPACAATGWYATHPQRLLAGYAGRLFTLPERLLSEPRALLDYMGALLLPRGPSLGVYTDDFITSHGLLDPPSTLIAIIVLAAVIVVAIWARKSVPAFFTGVGLYLAGHAMESTVFPLELYFEHRNYLPSVGFFLAVVGAIGWAVPKPTELSDNPARFRRVLGGAAVAAFALLTAATAARAHVWGSWPLLAAQGARQHPQSMRAQLDYSKVLQLSGQTDAARAVFERMLTMKSPEARHVSAIDIVTLDCQAHGATSEADVKRLDTIVGAKLQLGEMMAFETLAQRLREHPCTNITAKQFADVIVKTVDAAPQPASLVQIWRSRFNAAELYAAAGDLPRAVKQAALAWMTGSADPAVGVYLAALYVAAGDKPSARLIAADARKHVKPWDERNLKLLAELDKKLGSEAPVTAAGLPTK